MCWERMRETVKNVEGRANACERTTEWRLAQMGQDGRCEEITEETSSLSSPDETVIKHRDTLELAHTTIIPTFLSTPTGMASSPGNVKGFKIWRIRENGGI